MSVDLPGGRHAKVSLSVDESTRVLSGASIRLIDCSVCCTVVVHTVASVGEVPAASHQQSVQHESVSARRSGGAPGGAALTSIILGVSVSMASTSTIDESERNVRASLDNTTTDQRFEQRE